MPVGPGWEFYLTRTTGTVIETGEETVLVDTGHGSLPPGILLAFAQIARTLGGSLDVPPEEFLPGQLPNSLRAASLTPEDIDVVVLTHGHPDHVGGAVNGDGRPAFPNARYVMSRPEWEFWTGKPDLSPLSVSSAFEQYLRLAELTLPRLVRRVELVEDATEVAPGVTVLPAAGHTPGHLAVVVESQGEQFLHLGDAAQLPPHVARPEWTGGIDYLPEPTVATRRDLYGRAAAGDALTFGSHFPIPGFGKVRQVDDGWRWEPVRTG
ncbi:MBL fold metallo-hydrolase [Halobacteriaceae archaeon GCM10025711]